ncbi:CGNR zinc finger domain-containing protein [Mycobacterium yunnanensis]|uniref:CGNR zinc finger domain-containing protein n=1 Tax=Mycobacterium yunnanensis TaxID=368477 RepID=A0A9X3C2S8_9MYCO|nr:CGNR zinc finger domain-containing protein [Mycobacterium yunnanensis]MCV7421716.1 CGNR zinc finger domain-containing protein [Mycobacterium yunnanensis]
MEMDWSEALLELLNTTPVVEGVPTDTLDGAWLRAHGAAARRVQDVRALRDDLQQVVRGEAAGTVLGSRLRGVTQSPEIVDDVVTWRLDASWEARMVLAWGNLQSTMPGRLRPCANGECHLFLLDRSRGGTGRWCSMTSCGNRMKARRHYGRAAGKAT